MKMVISEYAADAYWSEFSGVVEKFFNVKILSHVPEKYRGILAVGNTISVSGFPEVTEHVLKFTPTQLVYHVMRHLDAGDYHRVVRSIQNGIPYESVKCVDCLFHQVIESLMRSVNRRKGFPREISRFLGKGKDVLEYHGEKETVKNKVMRALEKQKNIISNEIQSGVKKKQKSGITGDANVATLLEFFDEARERMAPMRYLLEERRYTMSPIVEAVKKFELFGKKRYGLSRTDYSRLSVKREFGDYLVYKRANRAIEPPVILLDKSGSMDATIASLVTQLNSLYHSYPIKVYMFDQKLHEKPFIKYPGDLIPLCTADGGTRLWTSLINLWEKEPNASQYIVLTDAGSTDLFLLEDDERMGRPEAQRTHIVLTPWYEISWRHRSLAESYGMKFTYTSEYWGS
jgi:hypothetical protein